MNFTIIDYINTVQWIPIIALSLLNRRAYRNMRYIRFFLFILNLPENYSLIDFINPWYMCCRVIMKLIATISLPLMTFTWLISCVKLLTSPAQQKYIKISLPRSIEICHEATLSSLNCFLWFIYDWNGPSRHMMHKSHSDWGLSYFCHYKATQHNGMF